MHTKHHKTHMILRTKIRHHKIRQCLAPRCQKIGNRFGTKFGTKNRSKFCTCVDWPGKSGKGGQGGAKVEQGGNKVGQWIARGERGRDRGEDGVGDDAGEDESNDAEDEMEARTHEDNSVE